MIRYITNILSILSLCLILAGCGVGSGETEKAGDESNTAAASVNEKDKAAKQVLPYHFADKEEGGKLLMSCKDYYDGFTENDLAFRMQRTDATLEEYKAFAKDQVLDFTDEEKTLIDEYMARIEKKIADNGLHLPPLDEIVFVCTTMAEEGNVSGYTHGTHIYLGRDLLNGFISEGTYNSNLEYILAHEVFHCLTRCNPDFRAEMYKIIHFTVQEEEYEIPPSVKEYFISNPDVEHHNAYAEFMIDGEPVRCFLAAVTRKHFEKEGERFFDTLTAALVPVDGTDIYYYPEDAPNYNDVVGDNTGYTIDPEECMADNFSMAVVFGMKGPEGDGYATPEIIEAILSYLKM